jgi:hypothetical protein
MACTEQHFLESPTWCLHGKGKSSSCTVVFGIDTQAPDVRLRGFRRVGSIFGGQSLLKTATAIRRINVGFKTSGGGIWLSGNANFVTKTDWCAA